MKRAAVLSVFCLWPVVASAAEYSSVYTKFDLDTCKVIEKGDEYVYAGTWRCKGYKGSTVEEGSTGTLSPTIFSELEVKRSLPSG